MLASETTSSLLLSYFTGGNIFYIYINIMSLSIGKVLQFHVLIMIIHIDAVISLYLIPRGS